jgi:hypothetical protein
MRALWLLHITLLPSLVQAAVCHLDVEAPDYRGKVALLYKYDDLVTERLVLLMAQPLDAAGKAAFTVEVAGVTKALLRIGDVGADFFLGPNAVYDVEFPLPDRHAPRTIGGTARVDPSFNGLDRFDVNALVSDLNSRLDAFLAEGLATDEAAGMHAVEELRTAPKDSLERPDHAPDVSLLPAPSQQRIDTLRPGCGSSTPTPRTPGSGITSITASPDCASRPAPMCACCSSATSRPSRSPYDDPEQMRFLLNFFAEQLMGQVFRTDATTFAGPTSRPLRPIA